MSETEIVVIKKAELREMILSVVKEVLENRQVIAPYSRWLTRSQVAKYLSVSVATIDVWRKKGLPEHSPNGQAMFFVPDIDEWMKSDKK